VRRLASRRDLARNSLCGADVHLKAFSHVFSLPRKSKFPLVHVHVSTPSGGAQTCALHAACASIGTDTFSWATSWTAQRQIARSSLVIDRLFRCCLSCSNNVAVRFATSGRQVILATMMISAILEAEVRSRRSYLPC
jgi:hypothetical protein